MKAYHVASLIVLLTPLSLAPAAWAGNCTSPVIAWKTGFRLSGSGGPARGDNLGTYTVNEAATSVGLVLDYVATSTSCTTAEWIGNANVTGSVNDEEDQLCPPHSALGQSTTKLTGSAFGSVAHINIDLSTNKFTFLPFGLANVTFKTLECDGSTSPPLSEVWAIQPTEWGSSNGSPAVPPAFPLPSKVQPLSGELPPDFKGKTFFGGITIPWNLIFHADPVIDTSVDDPCEWIVGSRIGCQNQSLGEEFRLVGTGVSLHYESNRLPGTLIANSVAQADALANGGWTFNVHHVYDPTSQRLYLGDGNQRSQWQLGNPVTLNTGTITAALINFNSSGTGYLVNDILTVVQGGAAGGTLKVTSVVDGSITGLAIQTAGTGYSPANGLTTTGGSGVGATVNITTLNYLITNAEGSEVYVFSPFGVHLKTVKPLTGALKYQFTYDASGNLIAITDPNGNKTVINREANGLPTSIVSPYGRVTTLTMNAQGFLSQMTDPAGHSQTFVYNPGGLMISRKDAGGNTYTYTYDGAGTLTKDANPEGGATTLTRTSTLSAGTLTETVSGTTAMGRTTSLQTIRHFSWTDDGTSYAEHRANSWPNGLQATESKSLQNGLLSQGSKLPDGTSTTLTMGPDPRWGMEAPVPTSGRMTLGNLTMNVTGSRVATLASAGNPFSLISQTEVQTINGNPHTFAYAISSFSRTYTDTSPVGRKLTTALDTQERMISSQVSGLASTTYTYDSRGRLSSFNRGGRVTALSYDVNGNLASITDPALRKNSFTYDADGNLTKYTMPDGRFATYSYDANGNLTSVAPPSRTPHEFSYNSLGLPAVYTPPSVSPSGPLGYSYNLDQQISSITRPDGKTTTFGYDNAGRISSIATATTTTNYAYSSGTGLLASSSITGGETNTYSYNGPLLAGISWSGATSGSVGHAYDNNFHVISRTINGVNAIAYKYDGDGVMTNAGALALSRASTNGLLTATTLGLATDSYTYNTFGEVIGYAAVNNGSAVYAMQLTRSPLGKITGITEAIGGTITSNTYTYDTAGRLTSVTKGKNVSTYTYDANSDRIFSVTSAGTASATYDADDRLLTYGTAKYAYTANGEIASQTSGSLVTRYQYDGAGNLLGVTLPNGTQISYVLDAKGRRVGRKVNGVLAQGFLYDGLHAVAQLNGSNQLISQFIYASHANSPDYMIMGGVTYRIFSDHLGSPRVVVNLSSNMIAQRMDYDEFGNVTLDTNPGFQPFGFVGGLYDGTTKLTHFGAREYSPAIGRWLSKDPILFAGGDTNLYGYTLGDPINLIDPDGNDGTTGISVYDGIGAGISISNSDGHSSIAIEVGVGTPTIGIEHNPEGKAYTGEEMSERTGDSSKVTIFGEGGLEGNVSILGVKITLIDGKIGFESEESPCPGKFEPPKLKNKLCIGPFCVGSEGPTKQLEGEPPEGEHGGEGKSESGGEGLKGGFAGKAGVRIEIPISF